ncbi:hypothetical protein ACSCBZ_38160 [Streptomyces niveiscabiei]|uniref:hypothetical protein n=1 Tax=Streptomyces TaxID=1883 RepID=UPI000A46AE85|nr:MULTISPECIES: hypothetical protein [Streptomyces]
MAERSAEPCPAALPEAVAPATGTLFAALYGTQTPYPWHDPENDPYQLFHQRSLAMGWLDVLWGMNDAGSGHPQRAAGDPELIAWFQVGAAVVSGERPLPVRPFLGCAGSVVERIGAAEVSVVQLLLPLGSIDVASRPAYAAVPSMLTREWFRAGDPAARTPVEVVVASGQDEVIGELPRCLAELEQDVFTLRSYSPGGTSPEFRPSSSGRTSPEPPFDDTFWGGPLRHTLALHGDLAAWSYDAVGWLGEALAELAARLGGRAPLLVTVRRST